MKRNLYFAITFLCFCLIAQAKTYNMQALGADNTGQKLCTRLINKTIVRAANEGGGTIYFPAGTYSTASIELKSNITIDLEAGATLSFTDNFEEYLPFVRVRWEGIFMNTFRPLFYAKNAENIAIKGQGTIDGHGQKWWKEEMGLIAEINKTGKTAQTNKLQQKWLDENKNVEVSPYYQSSLERKFFRPPFIQFQECKKVLIEGITIKNSPFWTVNPVGCEDLVIHGITINNPPDGHNTDGINPSSCKDVRISDCFISVGDDCVTIKSGRDKDGRDYGKACENLTITNCVMHAGHGGVVIGSEMSGGVKRVTISNCVFDGTDAGIRLKSSRGRGGVVEDIRVDNIVMKNIQRNAFIFDLFYDKSAKEEPVSERTPCFRNIHISNVTGEDVKNIGYINGISEMPVSDVSFSNIVMSAEEGFSAKTATDIAFRNVDFSVQKGSAFSCEDCKNVVLSDVRTKTPIAGKPVIDLVNVTNGIITNCFQMTPADVFCQMSNSSIVWGNNFLTNVKTEKIEK